MSARETVVLARVLAWRTVRLRRPLVDTLWAFGTVAVLAVLLVLAPGEAVAQPVVVAGATLLLSSVVAATDLPRELAAETRSGTLAGLLLSPLGFGRVALVRAGLSFALALAAGLALLVVLLLATGARLRPAPVAVLAWLLGLASALGLGLALGAVALLHERVEAVLQFVPLALLSLVVAPVGAVPALRVVPLAHGSHLVELAAVRGVTPGAGAVLLLAATALASLVGGGILLRLAARRVRAIGSLGGR